MPDYTEEIAFITRWLTNHNRYSSDNRGRDLYAAKAMVKADPSLEIVFEPGEYVTGLPRYRRGGRGGRTHIGWGGSKWYRGNWVLRRKEGVS